MSTELFHKIAVIDFSKLFYLLAWCLVEAKLNIKQSSLQAEKMVLVACGWRHTISVSSSGSLYTYGWSKYGQLGHGDFEDHLVPHKLEALHDNQISQVIVISYSDLRVYVHWRMLK